MKAPTVITEFEDFSAAATGAPAGARIPVEVQVDVEDPYAAYRRVRQKDGNVYFETTGGQEGWGYFATEPYDRVETRARDVDAVDATSFDALERVLSDEELVRGDCDVPYPCGAFGWISYDAARELEDLPETTTDDRNLPRLQFRLYDRVAAWEEPWEETATLRITVCPRVDSADAIEDAYHEARRNAITFAERALDDSPRPTSPPTAGNTATFTSEAGRDEYERRVRAVKEYVRDGDTFQANVSHRMTAAATVHPVDVFASLREVNPAPYSALVEFPGCNLVSTSPELLLDAEAGDLLVEPIAGTRPRGETQAEDQRLQRDLLESEKEHAEHAMLVDLQRNDLGKVSEYGTVDVSEYRRIDRYSEVMHTVSAVTGRLRPDASVLDAAAAVFPGGTITGAPKPRTMEIIDEMEDTRRGPYTGSIGVFGFDERATLNMTIRTLVETGGTYYLRVGAGIVHDSVPSEEYDETLDKGRALVNAIDESLAVAEREVARDSGRR